MSTTYPIGMHYRYQLGSSHFAAIRIYSSSQRPPNPPRNRITSGLGMLGAGGLMLFGKGKYILGALKLTKFASLGSMLLTVGAYTAFYGFPYAVGMTSLILIHESGHALVMKKLGIPFSPMVFVPFMGAAVAMKQRPKDAYEEGEQQSKLKISLSIVSSTYETIAFSLLLSDGCFWRTCTWKCRRTWLCRCCSCYG